MQNARDDAGAHAGIGGWVDSITATLLAHQQAVTKLQPLAPDIARLAARLRECLLAGGKIVWMGNGGSAADSQHLAAELVGRFRRDDAGHSMGYSALASLALTTDTSILTSVGNDYGFQYIFARQVEAFCGPQDVLVGISTSGNSENVIQGILMGRRKGCHCVGLLGGSGGRLKELCDVSLVMPSTDTPRIQEMHILVGHILYDLLEREIPDAAAIG